MTTPNTPLPSPNTNPLSHPFLSVFLPTALTLAAVLGLGAWLLHDGGSNAPPAAPVGEQRTAITSQSILTSAETSSLTTPEDDHGPGSQPPPPYVVYLVGSVEQAGVLRSSIAEADATRTAVGALPFSSAILVIGPGDEHILRGLGDAAAIRDSLDLPELVVVDLRTPA